MTRQFETERQQRLLQALRSSGGEGGESGESGRGGEGGRGEKGGVALLEGAVVGPTERVRRGLQAYRAHAGASAERALAVTFPTVRALVGEASFGALARAYREAQPPRRGDLFWLGENFAAFIAGSAQLTPEPYLADCARLEWSIALAEAAEDAAAEPQTFALLADVDPSDLVLEPMPGLALLASRYPVVSLWRAHRGTSETGGTSNKGNAGERVEPRVGAPLAFDAARTALAAGRGETAWVQRSGWRGVAEAIDAPTAAFLSALLEGKDLASALQAAGSGFDFAGWLAHSLRCGALRRVRRRTP